MNRGLWVACVVLAIGLAGPTGCSDDGDGGAGGGGGGTTTGDTTATGGAVGCLADPFSCPAGQTCWSTCAEGHGCTSEADLVIEFACLNSGKGQPGEPCKNNIGLPTCGDGLMCFPSKSGSFEGTCSPYCDPKDTAHACPNGELCVTIQYAGGAGTTYACQPDQGGGGGGEGTGGGGGSGAGGSGAGGSGAGGSGAGGSGAGGSGGAG